MEIGVGRTDALDGGVFGVELAAGGHFGGLNEGAGMVG